MSVWNKAMCSEGKAAVCSSELGCLHDKLWWCHGSSSHDLVRAVSERWCTLCWCGTGDTPCLLSQVLFKRSITMTCSLRLGSVAFTKRWDFSSVPATCFESLCKIFSPLALEFSVDLTFIKEGKGDKQPSSCFKIRYNNTKFVPSTYLCVVGHVSAFKDVHRKLILWWKLKAGCCPRRKCLFNSCYSALSEFVCKIQSELGKLS